MYNVDNVQLTSWIVLIGVAKENHVVAECRTAIMGAQLWSRMPDEPWQVRQVLAMVDQFLDESISRSAAHTLALDVIGNLGQMAQSRSAKNQLGQL